jgi:hypothetical protein
MTIGLSAANEYPVLIVRFYVPQPAQVGGIRINGEGAGHYIKPAIKARPLTQLGELIGHAATTLPQSHNN